MITSTEIELERLRKGIELYRRLIRVHCVATPSLHHYQTVTDNNAAPEVWAWEKEEHDERG